MGVTTELSEYVTGLQFASLAPEVVEQAKLCLLDLTGIMLRARRDAESSPPIARAVRRLAGGSGPCTAVGDAQGLPAASAALLNGAYAHSLDFDDTHRAGSLHPGACVIPAALAVAEEAGLSGRDLLAAIVAGYDVSCRLGMAVDPSTHYARGFHPTSTCGVFGAAAAAGRLGGLPAERVAAAFGVASSQAGGLLQFLENGSWNKRLHAGFAASAGIESAWLAAEGVVGAAEPIEGRLGFLHAYSDDPHPELVTEGLGERFEITRTGLKPYPSCRYSHSVIDGLREIFAPGGVAADDAAEVEVFLNESGMRLIGAPEAYKRRPQNVVDGQFSVHYLGAVAALHGNMGWEDYRYIGDPEIAALSDRITATLDPGMAGLGTRIVVRRRDGSRLEREIPIPKGEPENPMTRDEVRAKFMDLAGERAAALAERILAIESVTDVREVVGSLRAAG